MKVWRCGVVRKLIAIMVLLAALAFLAEKAHPVALETQPAAAATQ